MTDENYYWVEKGTVGYPVRAFRIRLLPLPEEEAMTRIRGTTPSVAGQLRRPCLDRGSHGKLKCIATKYTGIHLGVKSVSGQ
jgi:hypothetical protein